MQNVKCTSCAQPYQEQDNMDAYLCPPCLKERKAYLAKLDVQRSSISVPQPSFEERYRAETKNPIFKIGHY